jgi:hypothetical protein
MEKIIIIFLAASIIAGCNQGPELSKETNGKLPASEAKSFKKANNRISFKLNGQQVHTLGWTISRFTHSSDPLHEWLNITTDMKADKRTINVNLNGSIPGNYSFEENIPAVKKSHGAFYPNYLDDMGNSYSFSSGSFTIIAIDTTGHTVNAVFSGTVKNLRGETFEITEGEISDGLLNSNVIRY